MVIYCQRFLKAFDLLPSDSKRRFCGLSADKGYLLITSEAYFFLFVIH